MPTKLTFLMCALGAALHAAETGDQWIEFPVTPGKDSPGAKQTGFESLKAEVIIGKLNFFWRADRIPASAATLHYSPDHPGHWSAREWRELPMRRRENLFDVKVPVHDIDVPIVYFVSAQTDSGQLNSPARMVNVRQAGMEYPSTVFWPFVEGFESNARNWSSTGPLFLSAEARSGNKSLQIRIPADKRSVSAATTRIRGWHILNQRAQKIRVWLKSTATGKVNFTLAANARTPEQTIARSTMTTTVTTDWQAIDIPVTSFPLRNLAAVDLFTIDYVGESGSSLMIDDLQLLGRWRVKGL